MSNLISELLRQLAQLYVRFREVPSVNPSVIGERTSAALTLHVKKLLLEFSSSLAQEREQVASKCWTATARREVDVCADRLATEIAEAQSRVLDLTKADLLHTDWVGLVRAPTRCLEMFPRCVETYRCATVVDPSVRALIKALVTEDCGLSAWTKK